MGQKGSNTTTTQTAPNPAAMGAYLGLLNNAQGVVANNPFQTYSGEFVAPLTGQQYTGIGGINQYANAAQPAISQAELLAMQGATPISAADIQNYYNPYQQNVIGATQAQFANMNAQQQQQVLGNAALAGALGGDRTAVAQANLAGQQQLSQAPVIAGLESQGFNQAAQLALAAKQQQAQGAYSLGNLGVAGQQAGLTGAGAQIQAGTLEQQTQQQLDAARYNQFLMQQAFPYQQYQWLAGIDTGVGSQMGGTSQTQAPPPNLLSQLGGLGLTAAAFLAKRGGGGINAPLEAHQADDGSYHVAFQPVNAPDQGHAPRGDGASAQERGKFIAGQEGLGYEDRGKGYDGGGGVPAPIGQPLYGGVSGFIPSNQITRGAGPPKPPSVANTTSGADKMIQDATKLAGIMNRRAGSDSAASGLPMDLSAPPAGPLQDIGGAPAVAGLGAEGIYAKGGMVGRLPQHNRIEVPRRAGFGLGSFLPRHYDDGGVVLPDGTIDHGTIVLDPEDVPGQGISPQVLREQEGERAIGAALARGDTGGVPQEGGFATALPFAAPDRGGIAPASQTPVADAIAQRYGASRSVPPAPEHGIPGLNLLGSNLSPRTRESLMAAGLGMLASRSPFAGVAIGEGGLRGLQTYQQIGQEQRAEAMSQQKINQAADQLALHAEQVQKNLALKTREFEEPKGFRRTGEGGLEPIPGGPGDPAYLRAVGEAKGENWKQTFDPTTGQILWFNTKTMETRDQQGRPVTLPGGNTPLPSAPGTPTSQEPALPSSPTQVGNVAAGPVRVASADPNIVGIVRANTAQAAQPYNYGHDAPYMEKGMEVPEPQSIGGKSTAAIKQAGEYFLQTGKLPAGFSIPRGNNPVAVTQALAGNSAINYANALAASRGMTPEQMAEGWRTAPGMLRFVLGPDGRSTVALGTAVRHLDTLHQLADAWAANDIQTLNRLRAVVSREFGNEAATNLQAAGRIIGPEIIKAIGVAGAGTAEERQGAQAAFSTTVSPEQMRGAIETTQKLLGGQLEGRQRQAQNAGVSSDRFKSLIGDRPYEILTHIDRGGGGAATRSPQDQQALDWANAHPADPRAVQIKQRLGVQ